MPTPEELAQIQGGIPTGPMDMGPQVAPEGQRLAVLRTNVPGQGEFERRFAFTPPPPPDPMEILSRRLLQQFQNLPIQQSQAAIEAAVKFQGLTGYRKALEKGESPVTAFQKYGPMLFFSNLGAFGGAARNMAASTLRNIQPRLMTLPDGRVALYNPQTGQPSFLPKVEVPKDIQPKQTRLPDGRVVNYNPNTGQILPDRNPQEDIARRALLTDAQLRRRKAQGTIMNPQAGYSEKAYATNMLNQASAEIEELKKPKTLLMTDPDSLNAGRKFYDQAKGATVKERIANAKELARAAGFSWKEEE